MNQPQIEHAQSPEVLRQSSSIGCYSCLALYAREDLRLSGNDTVNCPRCCQATLIGDAGVNELSRTLLVALRRQYVAQ